MVMATETPLGPCGRCQALSTSPGPLRAQWPSGTSLEVRKHHLTLLAGTVSVPRVHGWAWTRPHLGHMEGRRGAAQGQRGRPGHSGRGRAEGRQVPQPLLLPTAAQGPHFSAWGRTGLPLPPIGPPPRPVRTSWCHSQQPREGLSSTGLQGVRVLVSTCPWLLIPSDKDFTPHRCPPPPTVTNTAESCRASMCPSTKGRPAATRPQRWEGRSTWSPGMKSRGPGDRCHLRGTHARCALSPSAPPTPGVRCYLLSPLPPSTGTLLPLSPPQQGTLLPSVPPGAHITPQGRRVPGTAWHTPLGLT